MLLLFTCISQVCYCVLLRIMVSFHGILFADSLVQICLPRKGSESMPLIDRSGVACAIEDLLLAEIDAILDSSDTHDLRWKVKVSTRHMSRPRSHPHATLSVILAFSRRSKRKNACRHQAALAAESEPKVSQHSPQESSNVWRAFRNNVSPFRRIPTVEKRMSHSTFCK